MIVPAYYEDLHTHHLGTTPNRAYFIPASTRMDDLVEHREHSDRFQLLNGDWKFKYFASVYDLTDEFYAAGYDASDWNTIPVPSVWQNHGYDQHQYTNIRYPFPADPPFVPYENPCGAYLYDFVYESNADAPKAYLNFDGVDSCFYLWLNGTFLGYNEVSHSTSEFDVTETIREGKNTLAVMVLKWCDGSYLEDQDKFRTSGIFRDVYILKRPESCIRDYFTTTLLDEEGATVRIRFAYNGEFVPTKIKLLNAAEKTVGTSAVKAFEGGAYTHQAVFSVKNPTLWNPEQPYLYTLLLETPNEIITDRIGFREIHIENNMVFLNGNPIKFRGVNRHDSDPVTGPVISVEHMKRDLRMIKEYNFNAIRTSHYPDDTELYRLCDEYGLYLIAENNMETHGSWANKERSGAENIIPGDHKEWEAVLLDRVNSCYQRDKNHPAILIWSCGNESYGGSVIYEMSRRFHQLDPDRLVHYEGVFNDRRYNVTSDMESQMYPPVESIKKFLAEHPDKPFICCEYTHSMGNSNGGMFKYTQLAETEPRYQGGFIWDFADQSLRKKDRYGNEYQAYGGDCMERPTDYSFSGNGIVAADRLEYPKLQEVKFLYQNISVRFEDRRFTVVNRNLFVSTDRYACIVSLEKEGKLVCEEEVLTATAPLQEETYELPFVIPEEKGEYAVTVSFRLKERTLWAEAGYELAFGQNVVTVSEEGSPEQCGRSGQGDFLPQKAEAPELIDGTFNFGVKGADYDALFSMLNKMGLKSYRYGGKEMIELPPRPNFWRAPTDNDKGNNMPGRYGMWKLASLYASEFPAEGAGTLPLEELRKYPKVEKTGGAIAITYRLFLPTVPEREMLLTLRFHMDGTVDFIMDYEPDGKVPQMPEFGLLFTMNADYDQLTWYGNGPEETYCDRDQGAKLGVYSGSVRDQMTRYLVPQECGNKTGVRWAKVTDRRGRGLLFSVPEGQSMNFSALPWTPDEVENAAHHTELPPVHHTIVRCSLKQMGVAGDDSWGARTQEEFLLSNREHLHFEVSMRGI